MSRARLVLVRHAKPSATYLEEHDPGLDEQGRAQAEVMAAALACDGPQPILSSPKRRARDTAEPLAARWRTTARLDDRISEIPAPTEELADRGAWLRTLLGQRWPELDGRVHAWREGILETLSAIAVDTVVVTHYLVINAAVGTATDDDRLVVFRPDYCSRTVLDVVDGRLRLVGLGDERSTKIG